MMRAFAVPDTRRRTLAFDAAGVGDVDGDGVTDFLVTSAWSRINGFRSGRECLSFRARLRIEDDG